MQSVVSSVAGSLAVRRSTRNAHRAGSTQQPIVKHFAMMALPFVDKKTKKDASGHDHSLRDVAIPRTVIINDPAKWPVT